MDDFLRISSRKPCRNLSSDPSATCLASLTLLDVITQTIFVNTDHEIPHYAVFSILQLLSPSYEQSSFSAPSSRKPHSMFFPGSKSPNFSPIKTTGKIIIAYIVNFIQDIVLFWSDSPQWAMASAFTRFLDHTQRRTTVGRTPLGE